jgi:hypothetical protein
LSGINDLPEISTWFLLLKNAIYLERNSLAVIILHTRCVSPDCQEAKRNCRIKNKVKTKGTAGSRTMQLPEQFLFKLFDLF